MRAFTALGRVAGIGAGAALLAGLFAVPAQADVATRSASSDTFGQVSGHLSGVPTAVIVRHLGGDTDVAERAVVAASGDVSRRLELIGGVAAVVDGGLLDQLEQRSDLVVSPDGEVELAGRRPATDNRVMVDSSGTSLDTVRAHTRTNQYDGIVDGTGIDIALIDSGVTPVQGMKKSTQVVNGPDLSFESGTAGVRHLDTFGHGTHLAGIINATADGTGSRGIAPGARVVSLKVADATGATDVSQVIAAIDWVIEHRSSNGLNIRVLALAFGTDSTQSAAVDPLVAAVEAAWDAGIVVIVAGGNTGGQRSGLLNPAISPLVVSVAAADTGSSSDTSDDTVPKWSSRGNAVRNPDVAAPGRSIVSLRVPGSYIDANYGETARTGAHGFRGSGTSQATAVTAAMAALMLNLEPTLTPDQVKYGLISGSRAIPSAGPESAGSGLVDLPGGQHRARQTPDSKVRQSVTRSTGRGSLDAARGTHKVDIQKQDGSWFTLEGEVTAFGTDWTPDSWAKATWTGSWSGTSWSGASWSATSWSGASWSGTSWSGASWSGASWSGASWSGASWSGASWSGASWSGASWSGASWSGSSWSSSIWD